MKNDNAHIYKIEVAPYDERWPIIFKNEADCIQRVLGKDLSGIYHIGSTSIPYMPAKPVIDILVAIDNAYRISVIAEKLMQLGYAPLRRQIIPHVSFITSKFDGISFHLHLHERGSPQINRHVNFRDYVTQHPKQAKDYAELKLSLAQQYAHDRLSYVSGKSKLVQSIDAKAKCWEGRKKNYPLLNTGPFAKDWLEENLIQSMVANLNVQMTHFAQYLSQVDFIRAPGMTLVNSTLPDDTFNYVLDADFTLEDAKQKISEITGFFEKTKRPFSWWLSPGDKPHELADCLLSQGYDNTENNHAMYFDLDAWCGEVKPISGLTIVRAHDEKTLRDFANVLAHDDVTTETYYRWVALVLTDEDPIEYYVGYVNEKPVVRGLTCYFAQVAGLYWLSTSPLERHKEYGALMQMYQLHRAKLLGFHIAVLQASNEAYPFYVKLGYQACDHYFREFKKELEAPF